MAPPPPPPPATPEPHLPPSDPSDPSDPTPGHRHRSFGPLPTHTDQCIRDAARFGFCDHTRLVASSVRVRAQQSERRHSARVALLRELLGFLALAMIFGPFFYLANQLSIIEALTTFTALSLGYLLLLLCGLPGSLTVDPREWLPPDARERLENPPDKPKGPPR